MSQIPNELKYTSSHEWAKIDSDGLITIGITDHAQGLLGDIVFVELPELDTEVSSGEEAGVVESVKAASDIYSPISGTVIEVNEALENTPDLINSDPYGKGWLFRVQPTDESEMKELMDADEYTKQVASEGH